MSNPRFSEYATSGAFSLSLSRNQVSALAMIAQGADPGYGLTAATLERKGLVEAVANPRDFSDEDRFEYRATLAGLLCARLIREAGLSNGLDDPVAAELAALRDEVERCRRETHDARRRAWSAMARKDEAERELVEAQRDLRWAKEEQRSGLRLKPGVTVQAGSIVRARDHHPDLTDAELMQGMGEAAE